MKFLWKIDNFDSEIFGFRVAKVETLEEGNEKNLVNDLIKNKIDYATYRVQSNNFNTIQALEKLGFIFVDGLITLGINLENIRRGEFVREIREASKKDMNKLKQLTDGLYSQSRIFNDSLISYDKANKFYIKWIENSILGKASDSVLVWEENSKILGYITLQKKGQIPLLGVSKEARGKGIAKKLVIASFDRFKDWGVNRIIIETQMGNIPALRVYQDCGFKIADSFLTLRWAKND